MTTFAEMQTKVNDLTKRPELVALTKLAIRMATVRAHQVDFFSRDQRNILLTYTPYNSGEIYTDITTIYSTLPLMRTPDFIQILDATSGLPLEILEYVVDYKNFWDNEGCLKGSVFTLLGATLRFRSLSNTGKAQFYVYQNPSVDDVGYGSWIADMYPDEVAAWAAAIVWMRSGYQEIAKQMNSDIIEPFKSMLVESHLTSKV